MKKWVIASDHGGVNLRAELSALLVEQGFEVVDLGPEAGQSVDYPDYGAKLAQRVHSGEFERGTLVCGSGIGISIAANRFPGVRAALIHDVTGAKLCREHNDANVICFGERTTGVETAKDCLRAFIETEFAGGRHAARVEKLRISVAS